MNTFPCPENNLHRGTQTWNEHLNGQEWRKESRHFVINLAGSGLKYTPGDSLGVFGRNPPALVDQVIGLLGFDPETAINSARGQLTLRRTLLEDYTLNRANRKIMSGLGALIPQC